MSRKDKKVYIAVAEYDTPDIWFAYNKVYDTLKQLRHEEYGYHHIYEIDIGNMTVRCVDDEDSEEE